MELALGRNSCANFNVWLFYTHTLLDRFAATAAVLGAEHPFAIGVSQAINGNNTDASLVVAAVARAETDTPASLASNRD